MKEIGGGGIAVAPFSFASFYSAAEFTLNQKHLTFCNSLPLFVPLSLLLCSRLQHSQLLWGLQSYAIAQAESWGWGLNEVGE